jgi:hypothetical protein
MTDGWHKSSYSNAGGACVEARPWPLPEAACSSEGTTPETWKKSSYSNATGECVETASQGHQCVLLRDTQHRDATTLAVPAREWIAFLNGLDHL